MKRAWAVLLLVSLLTWAAPATAETWWEILSPTEQQTVSGMVDVTFSPFGSGGSVGAGIEVAPPKALAAAPILCG